MEWLSVVAVILTGYLANGLLVYEYNYGEIPGQKRFFVQLMEWTALIPWSSAVILFGFMALLVMCLAVLAVDSSLFVGFRTLWRLALRQDIGE